MRTPAPADPRPPRIIFGMTSWLAFAVLAQSPNVVTIEATDDVWVYGHAQDQTQDEYVRCWGADGQAVSADGTAGSWSLLKFAVKPDQAKGKPQVFLELTMPGKVGWDAADAKAFPLQVRWGSASFSEKEWEFGLASTVIPSAAEDAIIGVVSPEPSQDEKPRAFRVELSKNPRFAAWMDRAAAGKETATLSLARSSTIDPVQAGEGGIYKFFSRTTDNAAYRPKLILSSAQ